MRNLILTSSVTAILVLTTFAEACVFNDGFIPNGADLGFYGVNDPNRPSANGMTEQKFVSIISEVGSLYSNKLAIKGISVKYVNEWKNKNVNAYVSPCNSNCDSTSTEKKKRTWGSSTKGKKKKNEITKFELHVFGGIGRHALITEDGLALVVCHELGHILAGSPRYMDVDDNETWASTEGQADYFATTKCLRKYFKDKDNAAYLATLAVPATAQEKCFAAWGPSRDHGACVRMSMAGYSIGSAFAAIRNATRIWGIGTKTIVAFDKKDPTVVKTTDPTHPKPQCRLDTYFNGSQCLISDDEDFGVNGDTKTGACDFGTDAGRPACWFAE